MASEEFGSLLIQYCKNRNYNQSKLAKQLHVSRSTVSHWINGPNNVSYESVSKIAELLRLQGNDREELFRAAGYPLSSIAVTDLPFPTREEPPDTYVYRAREFEALKNSILQERQYRFTAITSALKGAGGYGKTTLAQALCWD